MEIAVGFLLSSLAGPGVMNRWQQALLPGLGISGLSHHSPGEATLTSPEPYGEHGATSMLGCENAAR